MPLGDLSTGQRKLLDSLVETGLDEQFYLSGGTALSAFHLHHRKSEDLDLFARNRFDAHRVLAVINAVSDVEPIARRVQDRLGFVIRVAGEPLRVEFVHYDFDWIEAPQPRHGRLRVDGLRDIFANKLSAIVERTEPKDFADVYFLIEHGGLALAQAMDDCRRKFGWPGLDYLLQPAFLRAASLGDWPETEPKVALDEAHAFFRRLARSLIRVPEE